MRLSLLQPGVRCDDVEANARAAQALIDTAEGDLLVLPEYALTGPPRCGIDPAAWAAAAARALAALSIPPSKALLANALVEEGGSTYNCCELLGTGQRQCKLSLTRAEVEAGLAPGRQQHIFEFDGARFAVLLCPDYDATRAFSTDGVDFALWISHVDRDAAAGALTAAAHLSQARSLRVFLSSLIADDNSGLSAYVDERVQLSLPRREAILEVILA